MIIALLVAVLCILVFTDIYITRAAEKLLINAKTNTVKSFLERPNRIHDSYGILLIQNYSKGKYYVLEHEEIYRMAEKQFSGTGRPLIWKDYRVQDEIGVRLVEIPKTRLYKLITYKLKKRLQKHPARWERYM